MTSFKPMKAVDWYENNVKFPCIAQPKIDGVYGANQKGSFLSRTLNPFGNTYVQQLYSNNLLHGFCGELIAGTNPAAENLCSATTSVVSRHSGSPVTNWWVFDYVPDATTAALPYLERMSKVVIPEIFKHLIKIVPSTVVNNMEELLAFEAKMLEEGYEGVILRDIQVSYKYGRCGKTHMGVWRIKRMIEEEIKVTTIIEGNTNNNAAQKDNFGRTKRSSSKENLEPNGMVGAMEGPLVKDMIDPITKKVLITAGTVVRIGPGEMTEKEREYYFANQSELLGKYVKFRTFPKGVKDKPRFPVFVSIRAEEDMDLSE